MAGKERTVRALYDFESGGGSELAFAADEILTIVNQDVGDGWVEAKNSRGQTGLIPEAYTEIYIPEPKMPPPPPPSTYMMGGGGPPTPQSPQLSAPQLPPPPAPQQSSGWSAPPSQPSAPVNNGYTSNQNQNRQDSYEDWDDDWDDDDSSTTTETQDVTGSQYLSQGGLSKKDGKHGTVSKKFGNRFSAFSKSGGDAYLFGTVAVPMPESEKLLIVDSPDGPIWSPIAQPFTCFLASPKKETKFHGMKSFIAYQITPSFSNIQVSRRYKHFDWLHERLSEKFTTIIVPPLPDKQISGRYEEDFISERMRQLQVWIDRMCHHPVICHTDVFHHFMSCTDEKRWKQGKRRAEKDEFQGGKFFLSVKTPGTQPLDQKDVEQKVERFSRFVKSMDDSVRHLFNIGDNNVKKHNAFRKEFQKLGNSFESLARSFEFDERPESAPSCKPAQNLTQAVQYTGKTYNDIGQLFAEQPRTDMIVLLQTLEEYKGILSVFPDALSVHRGASQKIEESYNKLKEEELAVASSRIDMISYAILAEMNHFNEHRVPDFKAMMQHYLKGQIGFYQKITHFLEDALQKYEDA